MKGNIKVNSGEFAKAVGKKVNGGTKKQSLEYIEAIRITLMDFLANGEKVHLKNFGTFEPYIREERKCRNPKNNETIIIDEMIMPKFKASENFREEVNKLRLITKTDN